MASEGAGIRLELRNVGGIEGSFLIPSYQRGYRWGEVEVSRLLDDISQAAGGDDGGKYCLQPVVVRRSGDGYELIDGQQRLTTLFIIYQFLHRRSNGFLPGPRFSLEYETRTGSKGFLESLDPERRGENIDFWHIMQAYDTVAAWFDGKPVSTMTQLNESFDGRVRVIWYEVGEGVDPIALFTRLNIGKIPLTSSELVKAMFLSESNAGMTRGRQEEVSLQWDNMERELHDGPFWSFLSNGSGSQTRIDLVLDLMAGTDAGARDPYATFFHFDALRQESDLGSIWSSIQRAFLTLRDWYGDHDAYHKIGYLVASGHMTLREVFELGAQDGKRKSEFARELDDAIRGSVELRGDRSYADLSYENAGDYAALERLLFLFNVESVRRVDNETRRFPFETHKSQRWTLEHIHAQQSEGLRTKEQWAEWLRLHERSVRSLGGGHAELAGRMAEAAEDGDLTGTRFEELRAEAEALLSARGSIETMHSLANLALLNHGDNAALNNSTFDVKRNAVIELDARGRYIPFCTKNVFLKYYTPSESASPHFWGKADRDAYIDAINSKLADFLPEPVARQGA